MAQDDRTDYEIETKKIKKEAAGLLTSLLMNGGDGGIHNQEIERFIDCMIFLSACNVIQAIVTGNQA